MKTLLKQLVVIAALVPAFCFAVFAQQGGLACPEIKVLGPPSSITSGDIAVLTVTVGDRVTQDYQYDWVITAGTISQGQGTSQIEISTSGLPATEITFTVKVSGLPKQCVNTVSETVAVSLVTGCGLGDEFGDIPADDVRSRLDNFFVELRNDPDSSGLIQISFRKKDSRAAKVRMVKLYFNHLLFREIDLAKITFAFVESNYRNTRLQLVPLAAQLPVENGSIVIPAEYLKEQIPYVIR